MAEQQQHAWSLLRGLGLGHPIFLLYQRMLIPGKQGISLGLTAEQFPQVCKVAFERGQIRLGREHLHLHPCTANLRQHRRWPHFLRAHKDLRAQAENAFGRQLPLVTNARQGLERGGMLSGGIHPDQLRFTAHGHHPFR